MENKLQSKTFTREELYNLIWATPVTNILKEYLISRDVLRKICLRMSIPLPKSGFWEKLKAGKEVEIEKLTTEYEGKEEISFFIKPKGGTDSIAVSNPLALLELEIETQIQLSIKNWDQLVDPDPLIITAKKNLDERMKKWRLSEGIIMYHGALSINVSKPNINRAFIFMDAFIKMIKKRGHNVIYTNEASYLIIGKEKIEINLREMQKKVPIPKEVGYGKYDLKPTGVLLLNAIVTYSTKIEWKDGKRPLEKKLSSIIARLETLGEELRIATINREKRQAEEKEKALIEKEKKDLIAKERWEFNNLLKQARRWKDAQLIRDFMKDFQIKAANDGNEEELAGWVKWANKMADWYDPSEGVEDDILGFYKESSNT